MKALEIKKLKKSFGDRVIFHDSLNVEENEFIVIMGASGSGKSTLLNMIGLLDKADDGEISYFDIGQVKAYTRKAEKVLKNDIGYLFQNFALIENESVKYNMMLALENQHIEHKTEKIKEALHKVGLDGYLDKKIYKCSGGEQQRISIARLLIKPCRLILADEPTGSLDRSNKEIIFSLLKELQKMGKTLVVVTHDEDLAKLADRVVRLEEIKGS